MAMGTAQVGVASTVDPSVDNNTQKRNATHAATNALFAANVAKKKAEDIKAKVEQMIEACQDVFAFAKSHGQAKERTLVEKAEAAAEAQSSFEDLLAEVVSTETADLDLIVGKIDEIRKAHAEV